ncbi:tRNA uridine(34) 5-carboxymethylaminomethyl modification radical SAM/GNAT enzyme Elp3 [Candidatus Peregrinibacteria bacterium]|nr:MAG: tRNA uridine(34) 5-carboxymethylaminomethyl modification radical SAM/GNAT enzyme Elp3 [Candidatus Peregrinibacteria bacterium]
MNLKKQLLLAAQQVVLLASQKKAKTKQALSVAKNAICREMGINTFPDALLVSAYETLVENGTLSPVPDLQRLLMKRGIRTLSGIAPISVLLPPGPCKSACVYCPLERSDVGGKTLFHKDSEKKYGLQSIPKAFQKPSTIVMPKSYLSSEPGAMRALLSGFDPFLQISRRIAALRKTGHSAEKCELIVQGGTFSDYPKAVRTRFLTRCYAAFNGNARARSLSEEIRRNETADCRVIGLTLETRPGCITPEEIRDLRKLGCTRVEIGVQTLDDTITKTTKRLQTREEVVRATALLRQAGLKICYHIMPGLPGSTPEKDIEVYREVCENPDFCPDLVKIYPCSVVPFSELEKWHSSGKYVPYSEETLRNVLLEIKRLTPPWIRISRLIRDIPGTAILGGSKTTNLRQLLQEEMRKDGKYCQCIRCREIRGGEYDPKQAKFVQRSYLVAGGMEHFLSMELADKTLLALLRLRIPGKTEKALFRALANAGIVRELHTYGSAIPIGGESGGKPQHSGFGKRLLEEAEKICRAEKLQAITVIAGVGAREYYRKLGFIDAETYVRKEFEKL